MQKLENVILKIIEECSVTYKELQENHFLWNSKYYLEDEDLMRLKKKSVVEWKKLSEIADFLPKSKEKQVMEKHKENINFSHHHM